MPRGQTAIGIDIGAHAVKAVLVRRSGGRTSLLRAATAELGELAFLEDSERKDQRIGELARRLVRQSRIRGARAGAGLAGRDYFLKYFHVPPAPRDKLQRLIEYEIAEDPASAAGEQTSDFWLLDLPSKSEEFTVLVAMARNEALERRLGLLKRIGLRTPGLTLNSIGVFNAYLEAMDEAVFDDKTVLLVDIGSRHTEVVVQRNAKIYFVRNLTLGGHRFTEALQEEFHLPISQADSLKLTRGALLPRHFDVAAEIDTGTEEARISAALLEPAEAIYDTLQATINYCKAQTRITDLRIDKIVLSGRGACLPGLRELFAERFRLPVEILDPFANIDTSALPAHRRDEVLDDAPGYAVAVGLALRQFERTRIQPVTLLPANVRRRREFLARDAFLYAGAGIFLLAFTAMFYSSTVAASRTEQNARVIEARIKGAEAEGADFEGHKKRNEILGRQDEAVRRLFDTGRRCADAIAIFKEHVEDPIQLKSVTTVTELPKAALRRRAKKKGPPPKLTTYLHIKGSVDKKDAKGDRIELKDAKRYVDRLISGLKGREHLYVGAEGVKHPKEGEEAFTFEMKVYFVAPFYGGKQDTTSRGSRAR